MRISAFCVAALLLGCTPAIAQQQAEVCLGAYVQTWLSTLPSFLFDSQNPIQCRSDAIPPSDQLNTQATVTTVAGTNLNSTALSTRDGSRLGARGDAFGTVEIGQPFWQTGGSYASAWSTVRDVLTVTSPTLPTGTAVEVQVSWALTYATNTTTCGRDLSHDSIVYAELTMAGVQRVLACDGPTSGSFTVQTTVGETLEVYHALAALTYSELDAGESVSLYTDALHTATLYLVPTGDFTLSSRLGLSYLPPVSYTVLPRFDQQLVYKAGSTAPVRLQILRDGVNVSSSALPLFVKGVRRKSGNTGDATPWDPGISEPDKGFVFTAVDGEAGYRLNFKTLGLKPGVYDLRFVAGLNGPPLGVEFTIK